MDAIVSASNLVVLMRDDFSQRRGEPVVCGLLVLVHGRIFAPLAFGQDGAIVARDGNSQIDPGPMQRSYCACRLGWFELAPPSHRVPQFGEKSDALMSIVVEKGFEPGILGRLRGLLITALAILERSDQLIDQTATSGRSSI